MLNWFRYNNCWGKLETLQKWHNDASTKTNMEGKLYRRSSTSNLIKFSSVSENIRTWNQRSYVIVEYIHAWSCLYLLSTFQGGKCKVLLWANSIGRPLLGNLFWLYKNMQKVQNIIYANFVKKWGTNLQIYSSCDAARIRELNRYA